MLIGMITLEDLLIVCFAASLPLAFFLSIRYFFRKQEAREQAELRHK